MKFIDINKRFTEIVTQYIANGYTINTSTMSGSQGETAKVDLTNGSEIVRINLESFTEWGNEDILEGYVIFVGKSADKVLANLEERYGTVWTYKLEKIMEEKFYAIGRDKGHGRYYVGREEAVTAGRLHAKRYANRHTEKKSTNLTEKAMGIAKKVIRRKMGVQRVIESKVTVTKSDNQYIVSYYSKSCKLS